MSDEKKKNTPKDFFLWLGVLVTLYISAISLVILYFEYIEILIPDSLDTYQDPYNSGIRFAIASLIVMFPLYIYLTRVVNNAIRKHKEKAELGVRKWIIYFTLFIAGLTLVIDLITLVNVYLGGELSSQFVLKVFTIVLVIGGAFAYYVFDIRGYWSSHKERSEFIGGIVVLIVLASVIASFFIIGSPQENRLLRFDDQKVQDLQSIQFQVLDYYQQTGEVPEELDQLENAFSYFTVPLDPQIDEEYEYTKEGPLSFILCADFNRPTDGPIRGREVAPRGVFGNTNWEHEEGRTCFDREIDPELYPVREQVR